jgi:hypothetical protein
MLGRGMVGEIEWEGIVNESSVEDMWTIFRQKLSMELKKFFGNQR